MAGLPAPEIIEQDGGILVTLYKNKYSADQLQKLELNERQVKEVLYIVENGSITNSQYQKLTDITKPPAIRDLQELESKCILINKGTKGSSSRYELES